MCSGRCERYFLLIPGNWTMMKNLISLAGSLLILAILSGTGIFADYSLSHPFWQTKATLVGGAIGIAIALLLFWAFNRWQSTSSMLSILVGLLFAASIFTTWYFARIFIDSAVFEPLAGKIWFFGYHVLVALFVPIVALIIRRFIPVSKAKT